MWVTFDKIEYKNDITSTRTGKTYSGWVVSGIKKGYDGEPDKEWSKVFFENQAATIIEKGIDRHNQSIVQFLQKGVQKGDVIDIRMERDGAFWRVISMTNMSKNLPSYEPLEEDSVELAPF